MGIATGEVSNDFPTSMVLDDQIFSMSVVAQHCLESRREILTSDRVKDDARVLFHLLNHGLLDQEVMDRPRDGATRAMRYSAAIDAENIPPPCCVNPPTPRAPLQPIEEVVSDVEDSDMVVERLDDQIWDETTLSFLTGSNQDQGACHRAVRGLARCSAPYTHCMQAGDHSRPRLSGRCDLLPY